MAVGLRSLHGAGGRQDVGGAAAVAVGLVVAPDEVLLGDEGPLQVLGAGEELGLILRGEVVGVSREVDLQLGDLVLVRDPALDAEEVIAHPGAEGGAGGHETQGPHGAAPEDPEGLRQEHGGGIVADEARHDEADGQGHGGEGVPRLEALPEKGVEEPPAQEGAEGGHAEAEHRAEDPDGHHVPGPLALPAAVEEVGKSQEDQAGGGVGRDEPGVLQRDGGQPVLVLQGGIPHRLILRVDVEPLGEVDHGAEEVHGAGVIRREAEEEAPGEEVAEPVPQGGQEIEKEVEDGQGEDVAGQKGAEGGKAEEGDALADDGQDGGQGPPGVKAAAAGEEEGPQAPGHEVGDGHHGKAREKVREEEAFPPDGQGVHHADAAGVVEVAPHRHGAEDGVAQGDHGDDIPHQVVVALADGQGRQGHVAGLHHLHQGRGGHQEAREGGEAPEGPVAAEVFPEQRPVKERYL